MSVWASQDQQGCSSRVIASDSVGVGLKSSVFKSLTSHIYQRVTIANIGTVLDESPRS